MSAALEAAQAAAKAQEAAAVAAAAAAGGSGGGGGGAVGGAGSSVAAPGGGGVEVPLDPELLARAAPLQFEDDEVAPAAAAAAAPGAGAGAGAAAGAAGEGGASGGTVPFDAEAGGSARVTAGCVPRPGLARPPGNSYILFTQALKAEGFQGDPPASWKQLDDLQRARYESAYARQQIRWMWARALEMESAGLDPHTPSAQQWRETDYANKVAKAARATQDVG